MFNRLAAHPPPVPAPLPELHLPTLPLAPNLHLELEEAS
jgi:hypothetical protein